MREIIFRGKRIDNGEWVEGYYCYNTSFNEHWIQYKQSDTHPMDISHSIIPKTVCQYTGLKDKNGKKIFEGDILDVKEYFNEGIGVFSAKELKEFHVNELKGALKKTYITPVLFEDGSFVLSTKSKWDEMDMCLGNLYGEMRCTQPIFDFEIIGNIHDKTK